MSKLLIIIIVAVLIGVSIFFLNNEKGPTHPSPSPSIQSTSNSSLKSYTNPNFDDSFTYPGNYTLNSEYPNYLLLKKPSSAQYDWTFKVDTYQNATNASFIKFITNQLLLNCAADGPGSSLSCDKVTSQEPFTTASGISGYKIYLNQIMKSGDTEMHYPVGPFYVFDISELSKGKAQAINFYPANLSYSGKLSDEDAKALESLAKSFKFNN